MASLIRLVVSVFVLPIRVAALALRLVLRLGRPRRRWWARRPPRLLRPRWT